jgi:hypothetical protein
VEVPCQKPAIFVDASGLARSPDEGRSQNRGSVFAMSIAQHQCSELSPQEMPHACGIAQCHVDSRITGLEPVAEDDENSESVARLWNERAKESEVTKRRKRSDGEGCACSVE